MTRKQAIELAAKAYASKRFLEASWIMTMLRTAPDTLSEKELEAFRYAFFLGARALTMILKSPPINVTVKETVDAIEFEMAEMTEKLNAPGERAPSRH